MYLAYLNIVCDFALHFKQLSHKKSRPVTTQGGKLYITTGNKPETQTPCACAQSA